MSNDFTRLLLEDTAKRRKINLDDVLMANENEVTEEILKLRVKLYDELNATLYGHIASNKLDGLENRLREAFIDWDAYAAELTRLHEQFKAERTGTNQSDGRIPSKTVRKTVSQEVPEEVTTEESSEAATTEAQVEQKAELGNQEQPKGQNFIIPAKGGVKLPTTPKARFKANTDDTLVLPERNRLPNGNRKAVARGNRLDQQLSAPPAWLAYLKRPIQSVPG